MFPRSLPLTLALVAGPAALGAAALTPALCTPAPCCEDGFFGMTITGSPDGGAVLVKDVHPRGPAAAAGVRAGDRILGLDGREMHGARSVEQDFRNLRVGQDVRLTLDRDGRRIQLSVRLVGEDELRERGIDATRGAVIARLDRLRGEVEHELGRRQLDRARVTALGDRILSEVQDARPELRARITDYVQPRAPRPAPSFLDLQGEADQDDLRERVVDLLREYDRFLESHRRSLQGLLRDIEAGPRAAPAPRDRDAEDVREQLRDRLEAAREGREERLERAREELERRREEAQERAEEARERREETRRERREEARERAEEARERAQEARERQEEARREREEEARERAEEARQRAQRRERAGEADPEAAEGDRRRGLEAERRELERQLEGLRRSLQELRRELEALRDA